jgi:Sulfotransferase domain
MPMERTALPDGRLTATAAVSSEAFVEAVHRRFGQVHVVVAPPRTCSTLLARILWNVPQIGFYSHEPFDGVYHSGWSLTDVARKIERAVDLRRVPALPSKTGARLLLKELPFQVGAHFPLLARLTCRPIVFLIRDPRLAIASRMRKRAAGGLDPAFHPVESGWTLLMCQVTWCRREGVPYVIAEAASLREQPEPTVRSVCTTLGLPFDERLLSWNPVPELDLGLAVAEQGHWNDRVLSSTSIEPPAEPIPELTDFPEELGLRAHVAEALRIYEALRSDGRFLGARNASRLMTLS